MSLLDFLRGTRSDSAAQAKHRLQSLLAQERARAAAPDFLPRLQKELIGVIARYIHVDRDTVSMHIEDGHGGVSILEIEVELPAPHGYARR